jgi:hypothetical protein
MAEIIEHGASSDTHNTPHHHPVAVLSETEEDGCHKNKMHIPFHFSYILISS